MFVVWEQTDENAPRLTCRSVSLHLQPVSIKDFRAVADLETRTRPREQSDPPTLKYHLEHPLLGVSHRYLVVDGETPIGVANFSHHGGPAWGPARVTNLRLALVPEAVAAAPEALGELEALAIADHPLALSTWSIEDETYLNEAYAAAGYRQVRSGVVQDLDLVAGRDRLLGLREQTRARMASQGVTLRHAGREAPATLRSHLLPLLNQTRNDMPHTVDEPALDEARLSSEMSAPSTRADRLWTAWDGERLVALSFLDFPLERGEVWTGFTATDRDYRGRGIAQAVKNESVGQAIELGVPSIRTGNDAENGPMLAINRKLGYAPVYAIWEWLKTLA
jgi:GNAT superfamily N-acetyltransferase